ncbi:capsid staple protein [Pseudothauera rhizosphaerae]|uniref:Uncharacterized protein n=1 Tax=Pseudothauera rhizosphaerae TaxID=2565932 RepID=A0A4S4AWE8_9RHOO|nr:hypothetical protein [Pseudothauera rhizosphaerae]THF64321.1 hypothetical protein E6O51_03145 [Pseudothauera rhizosphaerae]
MTNLISMKLDKQEASLLAEAHEVGAQEYPYGLCLNLDDAALRKLGIDLPEVGKQFEIAARAVVTSVSSHERKDDQPERYVSLQITDLALQDQAAQSSAQRMYPNSGMA